MKKIINACVLSVLAVTLVFPVTTSAVTFDKTLSYGTLNSPDVVKLQQFLTERGFFSEEATGNYLALTRSAVMAFQVSVGVDATGFFGPLTMAAANKNMSTASSPEPVATLSYQVPVAQVSGLKVANTQNAQSAAASSALLKNTKTVSWETAFYPDSVGIDIHILRKISESPAQYEFVRDLVTNTPNDGMYTWTPTAADLKEKKLYVEIACSDSHEFVNGCGNGGAPLKY